MLLGWFKLDCRTYYQEVIGLTHSLLAIQRLLLRWVTVCEQGNHLVFNQRQCQLGLASLRGR